MKVLWKMTVRFHVQARDGKVRDVSGEFVCVRGRDGDIVVIDDELHTWREFERLPPAVRERAEREREF